MIVVKQPSCSFFSAQGHLVKIMSHYCSPTPDSSILHDRLKLSGLLLDNFNVINSTAKQRHGVLYDSCVSRAVLFMPGHFPQHQSCDANPVLPYNVLHLVCSILPYRIQTQYHGATKGQQTSFLVTQYANLRYSFRYLSPIPIFMQISFSHSNQFKMISTSFYNHFIII